MLDLDERDNGTTVTVEIKAAIPCPHKNLQHKMFWLTEVNKVNPFRPRANARWRTTRQSVYALCPTPVITELRRAVIST